MTNTIMNTEFEKYKNFQSVKDMLASGLSKEEVLKEIREGKDALFATVSDEVLCFLVARHLNVMTPKPNIKSQFIIIQPYNHSSTIALSKLKDVSDGSYVDIKGMIVDIFYGKNYIAIQVSNIKNTVRCSLFDVMISIFKEKKFDLGDRIKLCNVMLRTYNDKKEVRVNNYSRIIKLRNNQFKL